MCKQKDRDMLSLNDKVLKYLQPILEHGSTKQIHACIQTLQKHNIVLEDAHLFAMVAKRPNDRIDLFALLESYKFQLHEFEHFVAYAAARNNNLKCLQYCCEKLWKVPGELLVTASESKQGYECFQYLWDLGLKTHKACVKPAVNNLRIKQKAGVIEQWWIPFYQSPEFLEATNSSQTVYKLAKLHLILHLLQSQIQDSVITFELLPLLLTKR